MRLSRKKIIELCIMVWTWCARTGKHKSAWPDWDKYDFWVKSDCWFCHFDNNTTKGKDRILGGHCDYCPYYEKYGHCDKTGTFYNLWDKAKTPKTRKKYAKLFLKQIKSIK